MDVFPKGTKVSWQTAQKFPGRPTDTFVPFLQDFPLETALRWSSGRGLPVLGLDGSLCSVFEEIRDTFVPLGAPALKK